MSGFRPPQPPSKFLPFHVPHDTPPADGTGEGIAAAFELPPEYDSALQAQAARLANFQVCDARVTGACNGRV